MCSRNSPNYNINKHRLTQRQRNATKSCARRKITFGVNDSSSSVLALFDLSTGRPRLARQTPPTASVSSRCEMTASCHVCNRISAAAVLGTEAETRRFQATIRASSSRGRREWKTMIRGFIGSARWRNEECSRLWPACRFAATLSKARIRSELYNSSTRFAWTMEEGCNEVRLLHGTQPAMFILQHGMNERFAGASQAPI